MKYNLCLAETLKKKLLFSVCLHWSFPRMSRSIFLLHRSLSLIQHIQSELLPYLPAVETEGTEPRHIRCFHVEVWLPARIMLYVD